MRPTLFILATFLILPAASRGAESKDDPQAIVDKAIQAHGGADKLAKIKGQSWKAKGSMTAGGMKMTYDALYQFAPANHFRFDLEMEAGGNRIKLSAGTDGKAAWESLAPLVQDMAKEKQVEFHHNVYVMNLSQVTPLKDKAFTLTALGESKLGEQTLVGIKVAHKDRRDVHMYFDKKTGLLTKTSSRINDEFSKKEVEQATVLSGYRDRDGLKVFDKLTIQLDGKEFIVEEMSDQKYLEKPDLKQFAKPAK